MISYGTRSSVALPCILIITVALGCSDQAPVAVTGPGLEFAMRENDDNDTTPTVTLRTSYPEPGLEEQPEMGPTPTAAEVNFNTYNCSVTKTSLSLLWLTLPYFDNCSTKVPCGCKEGFEINEDCRESWCTYVLKCPGDNPENFIGWSWYSTDSRRRLFRISTEDGAPSSESYNITKRRDEEYEVTACGDLMITMRQSSESMKYRCDRQARVGQRNERHDFVVKNCTVDQTPKLKCKAPPSAAALLESPRAPLWTVAVVMSYLPSFGY